MRGLRARVERARLGDRFVFAGYQEDMAAIYEAVDLVVHPPEREPFGRVVAEAMAMGKPVVAVNAGGPSEIIRSGTDGWLVPPGNAEAMATAVISLARDTARRASLAHAARERILRDFGMKAFGENLEHLYQDIMSNSRPGRARR